MALLVSRFGALASFSARLADSSQSHRWCFRTIAEFITKATGYSHTDRLGSRPSAILRPSNIQETICTGSDFFHMLPEVSHHLGWFVEQETDSTVLLQAYSWREMVSKWRLLA